MCELHSTWAAPPHPLKRHGRRWKVTWRGGAVILGETPWGWHWLGHATHKRHPSRLVLNPVTKGRPLIFLTLVSLMGGQCMGRRGGGCVLAYSGVTDICHECTMSGSHSAPPTCSQDGEGTGLGGGHIVSGTKGQLWLSPCALQVVPGRGGRVGGCSPPPHSHELHHPLFQLQWISMRRINAGWGNLESLYLSTPNRQKLVLSRSLCSVTKPIRI